jgi:hypothetical protein
MSQVCKDHHHSRAGSILVQVTLDAIDANNPRQRQGLFMISCSFTVGPKEFDCINP